MIERTGVNRETARFAIPGDLESAVHEEASSPRAQEAGNDSEEGDFHVRKAAKIELEDPRVAPPVTQHMNFDLGIVDEHRELRVAEGKAREPEPVFADAAIKSRYQPRSGRCTRRDS